KFVDPNLPTGYAPFNIANLGGKLYVSYALQNAAKHDDVSGAGHGFIDVYSLDGVLMKRLVMMGALNSPWGLILATDHFGQFSDDLLVGNFGDGSIHAYDPTTGALRGTLTNPDGDPIQINGLWGLIFGDKSVGTTNTLFFSAGIADEAHGLLGTLTPAHEHESEH
ncbi:MAG TPA: TIGR03118 family protein, partial [Acidimicrobiales bacterium]|nr:TIGR03118 family protein [Acidimicrobiales bacterium]